jgi:hypothetical protein
VGDRRHHWKRQSLAEHAPARLGDQALQRRVADHYVFQQAQQERLFQGMG